MLSSDTTLQIYHRSFQIPLETYLNKVSDFLDPWDERAYQYVVHQSLVEIHDHGIVGMVRQEKDENYVYLDAAIRYPICIDPGWPSVPETKDSEKRPKSEYRREETPLIMDSGKAQRAMNVEKGPIH